jgi:hypothetical protein
VCISYDISKIKTRGEKKLSRNRKRKSEGGRKAS